MEIQLESDKRIVVSFDSEVIFDLTDLLAQKNIMSGLCFELYVRKKRHSIHQPGIAFDLLRRLQEFQILPSSSYNVILTNNSYLFPSIKKSIKHYGLGLVETNYMPHLYVTSNKKIANTVTSLGYACLLYDCAQLDSAVPCTKLTPKLLGSDVVLNKLEAIRHLIMSD